MKIAPLLYAAILFLLIRLTNDVPMRLNYLNHSWQFIIIELSGVVGGSYLCYYLAKAWIKICIKHKINVIIEYLAVIFTPVLISLIIMSMSHDVVLTDEIPDLIIPVVVTILMSVWMYLFLKYRYLANLYIASQLRIHETRNAKKEAELKLLRAQYHPHFLFNLLNTVYFSIDENNKKARNIVENISNIMRLQLYENEETVALDRELSAIESYIELCRLRFGESINIFTDIDRRSVSEEIHPHLLLPLIENAVKHSGGNPREIHIVIKHYDKILEFSIWNTVSPSNKIHSKTSGMGLANLKKRLDLLYENRHEFLISNIDNIYSASLKLEL